MASRKGGKKREKIAKKKPSLSLSLSLSLTLPPLSTILRASYAFLSLPVNCSAPRSLTVFHICWYSRSHDGVLWRFRPVALAVAPSPAPPALSEPSSILEEEAFGLVFLGSFACAPKSEGKKTRTARVIETQRHFSGNRYSGVWVCLHICIPDIRKLKKTKEAVRSRISSKVIFASCVRDYRSRVLLIRAYMASSRTSRLLFFHIL